MSIAFETLFPPPAAGGGGAPLALIDTETFTASGTWTKPEGARWVRVVVFGAGCDTPASSGISVGSGAGGEIIDKWLHADTLNATEAVTVGANGAPGGSSSFSSLTARGGALASSEFLTGFNGWGYGTTTNTNTLDGNGGPGRQGVSAGGGGAKNSTYGYGGSSAGPPTPPEQNGADGSISDGVGGNGGGGSAANGGGGDGGFPGGGGGANGGSGGAGAVYVEAYGDAE